MSDEQGAPPPTAISPATLEAFARAQGLRQAILVGWGSNGLTHVVTWGDSVVDAMQAGQGGNAVKKALGFPETMCRDMAPRVRRALAFYAQAGEPWENGQPPQITPLGGAEKERQEE